MKNDIVMKRIKTNIDQIAEQIGEDIADATATGDTQLLYERMIANLESLEFEVDRMAGKLLLAEKQ
jgi:hypothetical protein